MSKRILNGGIWAGIIQTAIEEGETVSELDIQRLRTLQNLPKNVWVEIDKNGNPLLEKGETSAARPKL